VTLKVVSCDHNYSCHECFELANVYLQRSFVEFSLQSGGNSLLLFRCKEKLLISLSILNHFIFKMSTWIAMPCDLKPELWHKEMLFVKM
jgi:hypothetical protein